MNMTPHELDTLAEALAERVASRLSERISDDVMIDARAVAVLLGCSVPTVERLTRSGAIPSVKAGRLRRYQRSDVLSRMGRKGGHHE